MDRNLKKGEILELDIEKYAFEGKGIAKIEREDTEGDKKFVVFVHGSYPGDKVKAELRRVKKSYAEGKTVEVLEPSENRVEPKCSYFGVCGGCKQQDLDYNVQASYKAEQVMDIYERLGDVGDFEFLPIVKSEKIFFYRNKMEFSFAGKRWLWKEEIEQDAEAEDKNFALGLHIPRMFDKVLDIKECYLQSPESNQILNFTRSFFKLRGESIYSTKTHEGYLRNLVIKQSHHTPDLMVNLVTHSDRPDIMEEYTDRLLKAVPSITTVINNVNLKKAQVAYGDFEKVYHGCGNIFDYIGEYKFRISANSFFQTNSLQAEKLYDAALQFAGLSGNETVYDLYSGAGTISIYVSAKAKQVFGFETVESSIEDAGYNTRINNISNCRFYTANLDKSFLYLVNDKNIPQPDVIIADPPRGGMNPRTVRDILKLKPEKVVYVSCNPATQIRDINLLTEEGAYKLVKIQPVDMFPHTWHIENVALLIRNPKKT